MKFGELIFELRIKRGLTLREFCRKTELDPGNWSKIERGIHNPPKSREVLMRVAGALEIKKGSDSWHSLFELASISFVPAELMDNPSVVNMLPVLFRTVRGEKPDKKTLEKLVEMLREK